MLTYRIEITPDDNGTFLVTCPDLPGVVTFGETREDARTRAVDAIESILASHMSDGDDIPLVESVRGDGYGAIVRLPAMTELVVGLHQRLRQAGVSRAELASRLGSTPAAIDRMFRLDPRTRLDQLEAAFRALGDEVAIVIRTAA